MTSLSAAISAARAHRFPVKVPVPEPEPQPDSVKALQQYCLNLEGQVYSLQKRCGDLEEQLCILRDEKKQLVPPPPKSPSIDMIMGAVCSVFHVNQEDVMSWRRMGFVTVARQTICYLAKMHTSMSMPRIGQLLELDHTTVLHAWRRIGTRRMKEPDLDTKICLVEKRIQERLATNG